MGMATDTQKRVCILQRLKWIKIVVPTRPRLFQRGNGRDIYPTIINTYVTVTN
jgi:hypothetical protein